MQASSWLRLWLALHWFPHLSCSFLLFFSRLGLYLDDKLSFSSKVAWWTAYEGVALCSTSWHYCNTVTWRWGTATYDVTCLALQPGSQEKRSRWGRTRTELPPGRNRTQATSLTYLLHWHILELWSPSDGLTTVEQGQQTQCSSLPRNPVCWRGWRRVSFPQHLSLLIPFLSVSSLDHGFQIISPPWLFCNNWPGKNYISEKDPLTEIPATNHCQISEMSFLLLSWSRYVCT